MSGSCLLLGGQVSAITLEQGAGDEEPQAGTGAVLAPVQFQSPTAVNDIGGWRAGMPGLSTYEDAEAAFTPSQADFHIAVGIGHGVVHQVGDDMLDGGAAAKGVAAVGWLGPPGDLVAGPGGDQAVAVNDAAHYLVRLNGVPSAGGGGCRRWIPAATAYRRAESWRRRVFPRC